MEYWENNPDGPGRVKSEATLNVVKFNITSEEDAYKLFKTLGEYGEFLKHWDKEHPNHYQRYAASWVFPLPREHLINMLIRQKEVVGFIVPEKKDMILMFTDDNRDFERVPYKFSEDISMSKVLRAFSLLGICI